MEKIARRLAEYFVSTGKLPEEKKEIIRYGLEICISTLVVMISILAISIGMFQILDGLVFMIFFTSVRLLSGGYHASTYAGCYFSSLAVFLSVALCAEFLPVNSFWIQGSILVGCYAWIYSKAPHINPNHPLSEETKRKNKKKLAYVMLGNLCLFCVISHLSQHYGTVAFYTTVLVGLTFWIAEYDIENKIKTIRKIRR